MQITFAFYILSFGIFGKNRNFARAKPRFFFCVSITAVHEAP